LPPVALAKGCQRWQQNATRASEMVLRARGPYPSFMLLRILGPVSLSTDDEAVIAIRAPKQRALLVCLTLAPNRVVNSSSLIESLWGDDLPQHPRTALQIVVSRLKTNMGPYGARIAAANGGYRLDAGPDEVDLVLAGFVSFADPVLPDVASVLAELKQDGVTVKILTGDNDLVAHHVCRTIGLDDHEIVSGEEIARLDDAALGHVAERAAVFARVSPAQKNRIILALKRRGHVVGFMGDGINDAPSLHTADVGISVMTGADVARDAAHIILGKPSLEVLHRGILEGRRASQNMMKYLLMGTSSNFGNMFSMAMASVFLPFLPMLPTQILLNNCLYDMAQITIPTDRVDRGSIARPQRWDMRLIRDFMLYVGPVSSLFDFLTFYVLLHVLHATETQFHTGWFVESLATQTLVLFVIRTMGNPFTSRPSRALAISTIAIVGIGLALPATPLGPLLGFTVPPLIFFVFLAVATATYLALVEVVKRRVVRRLGIQMSRDVSIGM